MIPPLHERSAAELARSVRARALSSTEIVTAALERIERLDPTVNAVVTLDPEGALGAAKAADERAGEPDAPPFLGVPMLVKDLHLTRGLRTTFGTASMAEFVPTIDDEAVARIRRAGFVVLGKTNVCELGTTPVSESALHGPVRNPWNAAHTAGGSSGGAAAAVAAGYVPVAHGSDGAGSIRIPASNCGLFGLKPSRGRVSNGPLGLDLGAGWTSVGAVAWRVADAAALVDVMRGYATGDPYWTPEPARPFAAEAHADPGPLRIGVAGGPTPWSAPDPDAAAAVEGVVTVLTDLGHDVQEMSLPLTTRLQQYFLTTWTSAVAANPLDPSTYEPFNRALAAAGQAVTAVEVLRALAGLQMESRAIVGACMPFDAVLAPTLTGAPLPVGAHADLPFEERVRAIAAYVGLTPVANVTGQPAVNVPVRRTAAGLPVGVQFIGRPAGEATLIRLAGQLEKALGWPDQRPATSALCAAGDGA